MFSLLLKDLISDFYLLLTTEVTRVRNSLGRKGHVLLADGYVAFCGEFSVFYNSTPLAGSNKKAHKNHPKQQKCYVVMVLIRSNAIHVASFDLACRSLLYLPLYTVVDIRQIRAADEYHSMTNFGHVSLHGIQFLYRFVIIAFSFIPLDAV